MPTVNEMLAALNVDELSPLEALTKLHELKRLAAGEMRATGTRHWRDAPGMWNGYPVYREPSGSPVVIIKDNGRSDRVVFMYINPEELYIQEETWRDYLERWFGYPGAFPR